MAVRGETIGVAFVKILADGKGMSKSIKKALKDADKDVEQGAEDHADIYGKAYTDKLRQNKNFEKSLQRNLRKQFGPLIADAETVGGNVGKNLALGIENNIKRAFPDLEHQAEELGIRISHAIQKDFTETGKFTVNIRKRLKAAFKDMKVAEDFEADFRKTFDQIEKDTRRTLQAMAKDTQGFGHTLSITRQQIESTFSESFRKSREHAERFYATLRDRARKTGKDLHSFTEHVDEFGDKVGAAFGRGARNNAINLMGALVRGSFRVIGAVGKMGEAFVDFARIGTDAFKKVTDAGGSTFQGLLSASGALLQAALKNIAVAAAGLIALSAAIGVMSSVLSLLAGAITALAASISFALIGAIAPLVGVLGPVAVAVGAIATAFIGMDKAAKKSLKEAVEPLKEGLKDLGDAARPGILDGIKRAAETMKKPLQDLKPLFKVAGDSVGDFIAKFAEITTSKAFKDFNDTMQKRLPDVMDDLGKIVKRGFGGLLNVFNVLGEKGGVVDNFLGYLKGITREFEKWGNTEQGRQDMREFFEKAETSAKALKKALKGIWDVLVEVFDSGKTTGDDMLTSLGENLEDFADWLKEPENKKAMEGWFEDAGEFAAAMGELAVAIAKMVDELDRPETRDGLILLVEFTTQIVKTDTVAIRLLGGSFFVLAGGISALGDSDPKGTLEDLKGAITAIPGAISDQFSKIGESFKNMWPDIKRAFSDGFADIGGDISRNAGVVKEKIQSAFSGMWGWVTDAAGKFNIGDLIRTGGVRGMVIKPFTGLGVAIVKAIGSVSLKDLVKAAGVVGAVLAPFTGLWQRILRAIGPVTLKDTVRSAGVVAAVLAPFTGLASQILKAIGVVRLAELVSSSGVFQAVVGPFTGLASAILNAIGTIDLGSLIRFPERGSGIPFVPGAASGGLFYGPTHALIGEAGPEAVVPLHRSLSQVDPAVRELSAIAQGLRTPRLARGGIADNRPSITMNVYSPQSDPRAVAMETINYLAAAQT